MQRGSDEYGFDSLYDSNLLGCVGRLCLVFETAGESGLSPS